MPNVPLSHYCLMSLNTCYVCMDVGNINMPINCKFEHHSKELFIFEQLAKAMAANSPNTLYVCIPT